VILAIQVRFYNFNRIHECFAFYFRQACLLFFFILRIAITPFAQTVKISMAWIETIPPATLPPASGGRRSGSNCRPSIF